MSTDRIDKAYEVVKTICALIDADELDRVVEQTALADALLELVSNDG